MGSFNDMMDVHDRQMSTDRQILEVFWCSENDNKTLGDIKKTLRNTFMKSGILPILEDSEKRHKKHGR